MIGIRYASILENGSATRRADHDCDGYGCIICDYSCGAGCWQEKVTPQERQDLLWEVLQQIIGKVGGQTTPATGKSYEDSYSKLLEEFLWSYGKEIQTDPRCSELVDDLMNLDLFPSSENWGTLKMSELGEYDMIWVTFGTLVNSAPRREETAADDEFWVEWHRENATTTFDGGSDLFLSQGD